MKIKNKGKVYPSPSSSSSSSSSVDVLSVLQLLPAAILALVSMLSLEDREVLAYMMTRSIKTSSSSSSSSSAPTTTCSSMAVQDCSKKRSKRASKPSNSNSNHKPPVFDCDCFDCYRSYWLRWNSSSHGELMDQAIEAFEENLTNGENTNNKNNNNQKNSGRGKRRDKMSRRDAGKAAAAAAADVKVQTSVAEPETVGENGGDDVVQVGSQDGESGKEEVAAEAIGEEVELNKADGGDEEERGAGDEESSGFVRTATATANNHKGLARKVLPDVLGLFNSRLWSLWGPNV